MFLHEIYYHAVVMSWLVWPMVTHVNHWYSASGGISVTTTLKIPISGFTLFSECDYGVITLGPN